MPRVDSEAVVVVPEGEFLMGVPADRIFAQQHETPQVRVWLRAYAIDVHPVTNGRYRRFVEDGGYENPAHWDPRGWAWRERCKVVAPATWRDLPVEDDPYPVTGVSWYEADAFCRWAGRQLPTSAQWEKAARGTDGRTFPWGETPPTYERANFDGVVGHPSPIGSYPAGASPYGCHDMSGNVNNWCRDWYWKSFLEYLASLDEVRDPIVDDDLAAKIAMGHRHKDDRGGGFATSLTYWEVLTTTRKTHWSPMARDEWHGFRTVREGP